MFGSFDRELPTEALFSRQNLVLDWSPGYSYVTANDYDGHGPDTRLYLRFKRIYTFLGAEAGYRFYEGRGRSVDGPRFGARVGLEVGFFSLHFAVSRDRSIEERGEKVDPTVWGFGATLTGSPWSAISRFF
jgi:hypothetical protein